MQKYDRRLKLDNFRQPTVYLEDYKSYTAQKYIGRRHDLIDEIESTPKSEPFKDHETFYPWRANVHIPFNLLWKPKQIIPTYPYKIEDPDKKQAIKTRPRVYFGDEICLDDITIPEPRNNMINFIYKSSAQLMNEDLKWNVSCPEVEPLSEVLHHNVNIDYDNNESDLPEYFKKGKRGEFEQQHRRALVDPTSQFWIHKKPAVGSSINEDPLGPLVSTEVREKIHQLVLEDKLALPYDYVKPGYAGYRPRMLNSIPLRKNDLPWSHPLHSVTEIVQSRYDPRNQEIK